MPLAFPARRGSDCRAAREGEGEAGLAMPRTACSAMPPAHIALTQSSVQPVSVPAAWHHPAVNFSACLEGLTGVALPLVGLHWELNQQLIT